MAKFVEVKLGCSYAALDECNEIGTQGDGTVGSMELTVDGLGREIQVCTLHRKILGDLLSALMEDGQPLAPPKKKSTKKSTVAASPSPKADEPVAVDLVCLAPQGTTDGAERTVDYVPCGRETKSTAGLTQHVTRSHRYDSLADYMSKFPESVPA